MSSSTVSIRISEAAKARLSALAQDTGRSSSFLAAEAIDAYLDMQEWQISGIKAGIRSLDTGRTVSHDAVKAWADSLPGGNGRTGP